PVDFEAVEEPVGILLSKKGSSKTKYFPQQERPYNVHDNVEFRLTKNGTDALPDDPLTDITMVSSNDNLVEVKIEKNSTGADIGVAKLAKVAKDHFSDKGVWPVTVKLTVFTPQTQITSIYTYTFNPQRYLF
ncbi:hypothetical protein, partial [Xenorhabdus entomophaga]|uniref:hypothetical protein n=1 Tax=Xenorhabdus entomophaga TaxID=3136257 RepID=UPI0030F3A655